MAALSNAVAQNLQASGAADEIKVRSVVMVDTSGRAVSFTRQPASQAKLRSIVARQLLRSSAGDTPVSLAEEQAADAATLEDSVVFDYLRQSLCTFTLPVFVAERPHSCGSDALASLGVLSARLGQTALPAGRTHAAESTNGGPVLRQLLRAAHRAFLADGPEGVAAESRDRSGAAASRSASLASQLAEADARVTGAVEVAELRASFAAQLEAYQRGADERANAEVEARLASLRLREVARVRAEERQRFETELSQVRRECGGCPDPTSS